MISNLETPQYKYNDGNTVAYNGKIKCPKGTRDYNRGDMIIRESMMRKIKNNFNKFGGQFMETPVFELRDVLMDKYGEDEKLIYDLAKQEAEPLCLRYDLTVPLARYVAMNRRSLKSPFKAARVGRVYRRDQPYMSKGRLREFWQCDFDIVRTAEPKNKLDLVFDDMEIVALTIQQLIDVFKNTNTAFILLINNRKLLDCVLDICNVPTDKIRTISSAIDKLDKKEWAYVKEEMIGKGIDVECAEMIRRFTQINGTPDMVLKTLKNDEYILENQKVSDKSVEAIKELELLLKFLKYYNEGYMKYIKIDMSMVRGLDYYTGIIIEAQFADKEIAEQYGSIAGGGRYDRLVERFVKTKEEKYPCVGSSLGFERIFSYLKNTTCIDAGVSTDVLICELSQRNDGRELGLYCERLKLLNELRNISTLNVEIMNKIKPSFRDQINYCEQRKIKWMCIIGEDEIKNNTVNLRRLTLNNEGKGGKQKKDLQIKNLERNKLIDFFNKIVSEDEWKDK